MKRKFIENSLLTSLAGILILVAGASMKVRAQGSNMLSKPRYTMEYRHNGTSWDHLANTTTTYDSNGNALENLSVDPVTNQNSFRALETYDSYGNRLTYHSYNWKNSAWALSGGQIDSINYTSFNKKSSQASYAWINNAWGKWTKYDYNYDANNNLIEEIYSTGVNGNWELGQRIVFTYDANNLITEKKYYQQNNGSWSLFKTETYSAWHTPNILPALYTYTSPNSQNTNRRTITLGPNGGYTELRDYYHALSGTWRISSKRIVTHDSQGNITNDRTENFINGAWQYITEHQNVLTYNNQFDITESIIRHPDLGPQNGSPVKDQFKYAYSNFQYFTRALGTPEAQKATLDLAVFPNPATDKIQIEFADQKPQPLTATITDVTGKTWLTKKFKAEEAKQLNIEALPKGVYILQFQTEAGAVTKRLVKQ